MERQQTEADVITQILDECARTPVEDRQAVLVFCGENWHRGVLGIVASRLVERFYRPVFVLSRNPEDGVAQGSGRSIPRFHLLEALESMPELFLKFGGHVHAAGLTLPGENLDAFRARFNAFAAARLTPDDFVPQLEIDAPLDFRDINERSVAELLALAPFGYGNAAPLFLVPNVEIAGPPAPLGEKHLRVPLRQNGRTVWFKAWNFAERLAELSPGARVDAAILFEEDSFTAARGYPGWTAVLRDIRQAESR